MTVAWDGNERRREIDVRWLSVSNELCEEYGLIVEKMADIEARFEARINNHEQKEREELAKLTMQVAALSAELGAYKDLVKDVRSKLDDMEKLLDDYSDMVHAITEQANRRREFWSKLQNDVASGGIIATLGAAGSGLVYLVMEHFGRN